MKRIIISMLGFVSICILIVLMTNCNRKENYDTEIKGQIRDFYTDDPISNVSVHIFNAEIDLSSEQIQLPDPLDPKNWIHTAISDLNGNFTFSFNDIKSDYCELIIYTDSMIINETYRMKIGESSETIVYVKHFKPVQIHVRNQQNIYDRVYISIDIDTDTIMYNGGITHDLISSYNILGFGRDTLIHNLAIPDGLFRIYYALFKQDQHIMQDEIDLAIDNNSDTIRCNFDY
jgi:hypothetical protein